MLFWGRLMSASRRCTLRKWDHDVVPPGNAVAAPMRFFIGKRLIRESVRQLYKPRRGCSIRSQPAGRVFCSEAWRVDIRYFATGHGHHPRRYLLRLFRQTICIAMAALITGRR